jgi:CDGSH-type Zn-finger protein
MSRIVLKTVHGPFVLKPTTTPVDICMCGLSANQPFCNGAHKKTPDEKEGEVYKYYKKGNRMALSEEETEGGCCGGDVVKKS